MTYIMNASELNGTERRFFEELNNKPEKEQMEICRTVNYWREKAGLKRFSRVNILRTLTPKNQYGHTTAWKMLEEAGLLEVAGF